MLHCRNWCGWLWFQIGDELFYLFLERIQNSLELLALTRPDECDDVLNLCVLQLSTELESLLSAYYSNYWFTLTPNLRCSNTVECSFIIMLCGLCWHIYKDSFFHNGNWVPDAFLCSFLWLFWSVDTFLIHILFSWNIFLCDLPLWKSVLALTYKLTPLPNE